VAIRAGIHSGDAVRDVDDFFGHAVTVAARVAAIAQGGEILVTRVVRDLVQGAGFAFEQTRSQSLKGIQEPVEVAAVAEETATGLADQ
jgi:class 3 adenylate cyclase